MIDQTVKKATVRGGAPYLWGVVLIFCQDAIGLDLVATVTEALGLRDEIYVAGAGIWLTGLALNIWAQVQGNPTIERILKVMPGPPNYADAGDV